MKFPRQSLRAIWRETGRDALALLGPRRLKWVVGGVFLFLTTLAFLPSLTSPLEYAVSDLLSRLAQMTLTSPSTTIILEINAESLRELPQQWPWREEFLADLIHRVQTTQPKRVILALPPPDRNISSSIGSETFETGILQVYDRGRLILSEMYRQPDETSAPNHLPGTSPPIIFCGHRDSDGRLRELSRDGQPPLLLVEPPATGEGRVVSIPVHTMFQPDFSPQPLQNKTVLIGITAAILHDHHRTPGGLRAGVELMATLLEQERRGPRIFRRYGFFPRTLLLLFGFGCGLLIIQRGTTVFTAIPLGITVLFLAGCGGIALGYLLPWGQWLVGFLSGSLLSAAFLRFQEAVFRQVMREEGLETAKIQAVIVPQGTLSLPSGVVIGGFCRACESAGGDFYDYFLQPDGSLFFFIGDVSGHGFPASLITTMAKAVITHERHLGTLCLGTLMERLNAVLLNVLRRERHMTAMAGLFQPETGQISLCSAGHVPAVMVGTDGGHQEIPPRPESGRPHAGLPPLGLKRDVTAAKIPIHTRILSPGDSLVLFTDGIVEARNSKGEELLFEGWHEILEKRRPLTPAPETFADLTAAIHRHTGGLPLDDDLTLLIIHVPTTAARHQHPAAAKADNP
jgi:serine phosphatase RsbU (regulator of sigma subunit)